LRQVGQKYGYLMKSGETCPRSAGWGTDHAGSGRCKNHPGGRQGARKGNKNALKHGLHEYIGFDTLDEDEAELLQGDRREVLSGVYSALDLLDIRERRILVRVKALRRDAERFVVTRKTKTKGYRGNSTVDLEIQTAQAASERILALDNVLSTISRQKVYLLRLLAEMKDAPTEDKRAMALIEALDRSVENVLRDKRRTRSFHEDLTTANNTSKPGL